MNYLKEPLINYHFVILNVHFVILNVSEESFATVQITGYGA